MKPISHSPQAGRNRQVSELYRSLRKALPFAVAATLVFWLSVLLIGFNSTASEPYGFYLRIPYIGGELEQDDLIQLRNPQPGLLGVTAEHLLKTVVDVRDDGSVYVMGLSPDSFDSRYFGWVDKSLVEAICFPIVTSDSLDPFKGYVNFVNSLSFQE